MGNQILLSGEYLRPLVDDDEGGQAQAALISIVCSSTNAVIRISRYGRVTTWSPGAEALYGFDAAEMIGRVPCFLFREDALLREGGRCDPQILSGGDAVHRYEARHFTRTGAAVDVAVALSPTRDRDGAMSGVVAVISDITERKRAEREIARARAAAEEAARLKSAIISNLSHEIRTPLNIILGYAEVINDYFAGKGDASQREALAAIMRAGDRLCSTVQEVLEMSKIEAGGFEPRPARIELDRVVELHVAAHANAARRKGLDFEYRAETTGVAVHFDEYSLTRALEILLDNAIKFTERGSVAVRLATDAQGTLCLEVRDTGVGIAPAHLARLFEPFSQQSAGENRSFGGLGLGLALCRRYLELNGALLSVESAPGRGSTFTIRFLSHEKSARAPERHSETRSPRRKFVPQFSF